MKIASLSGTEIAYLDEGEGQPIVLIHGFASTASVNWLGTGWVKTLVDEGYRVIAVDNRGHGNSTKFYDESDYTLTKMAGDIAGLISKLDLNAPHVMGYSMGCRITTTLASEHDIPLGKLVLAGNGLNMIRGGFDTNIVRDALLADTLEEAAPGTGRDFRVFAEKTGNDLKALAACIRGQVIPQSVFEGLENETLVIVGDQDDIAVDGEKLAELIPNGRFEDIPGRNHMNAVGDKVYKQKVLTFLSE
ncbi:MAG: alpha/beta hydrolase [Rhizobiaceae bacterium]|nr:alpha/beta hydrolase [Rhizobiaceae bacterium]